jgi:hypothetical protein
MGDWVVQLDGLVYTGRAGREFLSCEISVEGSDFPRNFLYSGGIVFPISEFLVINSWIACVDNVVLPRMIESTSGGGIDSDELPEPVTFPSDQVIAFEFGSKLSSVGSATFFAVQHYSQFAFLLQSKLFLRLVSSTAPIFRHLRSNADRHLLESVRKRFPVVHSSSFVFLPQLKFLSTVVFRAVCAFRH